MPSLYGTCTVPGHSSTAIVSFLLSIDAVLSKITPSFFQTYEHSPKIWVRNYQILENQPTTAKEAHAAKKATGSAENTNLVEIGPRFVLDPVRIFRGSFGGQTLYQNPKFVSPNEARAADKRKKGKLFEERQGEKKRRIIRKENIVVPEDPLGDVFR